LREDKLIWSGAEIADEIGVARSTGYRYLQSLGNAGFVQEAPGGFQLGP
jgi:DNA-binding IclR family transcriptional regulator